MLRVMIVTCMVVLAATRVSAAENRIFLDFNRDGRLDTIDETSEAYEDTVSLIFEFNEMFPINQDVFISYETGCRVVGEVGNQRLETAVWLHWEEGLGCNEDLFEYCYWLDQVCNTDCSCYNGALVVSLYSNAPMNVGRRYEFARFYVARNASWGDGRLRVKMIQGSDLVSNDIIIGAPASPTVRTSWGEIKWRYRQADERLPN